MFLAASLKIVKKKKKKVTKMEREWDKLGEWDWWEKNFN